MSRSIVAAIHRVRCGMPPGRLASDRNSLVQWTSRRRGSKWIEIGSRRPAVPKKSITKCIGVSFGCGRDRNAGQRNFLAAEHVSQS